MSLTGVCLTLLAIAAFSGWLDGPLHRLRLRPSGAAVACLVLLLAPHHTLQLSLTPLRPWLPPDSPARLPLDLTGFLLPLLVATLLAARGNWRRSLLALPLAGGALVAAFLWLPGEPATNQLFDPGLLYALAGGLGAALLAGSAGAAAGTAGWAYGAAEAAKALAALWYGRPVAALGADPAYPLLLAVLVGVVGSELLRDTAVRRSAGAGLPGAAPEAPPR